MATEIASEALPGPGVVILGAGQAGYQAATALRNEGYGGAITLIGEEAHPPYQRPPLSKTYLAGGVEPSALYLGTNDLFERHRITLLTGERVTQIDRIRRLVSTAGGRDISYEHLILATGARNRALPVAGADLDGVISVRSLNDAQALQQRLGGAAGANDVVIIGGGFLGLELASTIAIPGRRISIVEGTSRIMSRAVSAAVSQALHRRHTDAGCIIHLDASLAEIRGTDGRASAVILADGRELAADLVVLCVGVVPNTDLAIHAGLAVDNGIKVGPDLATTDPCISAIGDCANFCLPDGHGRIRLETVQNATDQAHHVARRIVHRQHQPYWSLPCFWSNQAGSMLHIAGFAQGADDQLILGDVEAGRFSTLLFRQGLLVAVESLNSFADHRAAQKILGAGVALTLAQAGAEAFTLRAFAATIGAAR